MKYGSTVFWREIEGCLHAVTGNAIVFQPVTLIYPCARSKTMTGVSKLEL